LVHPAFIVAACVVVANHGSSTKFRAEPSLSQNLGSHRVGCVTFVHGLKKKLGSVGPGLISPEPVPPQAEVCWRLHANPGLAWPSFNTKRCESVLLRSIGDRLAFGYAKAKRQPLLCVSYDFAPADVERAI
jgi:hypothetical protein